MSVKEQIIARLLVLLETLKVAGTVRVVERITTANQLGTKRPSIHLIIGAEVNVSEEEELRGYILEFPIAIILLVEHPRDAAAAAEALVGDIQTAIESDIQLTGADGNSLATKIVYQGNEPFSTDQSKPLGGSELTYLIQYRRMRGAPNTRY